MDEIVYKGKLFEVINRTKSSHIKMKEIDLEKTVKYELVRRPPGVRAIVVREGKILLNHEFRYELDGWDYRLPGGKVFDTLADYMESQEKGTINVYIEEKLREELREEAEIEVNSYRFLDVSHCGFTVEWDLYYYVIEDFKIFSSFSNNCIQKTEYEFIQHCWMDFSEVYRLCLEGEFSESRSAFVLLKYLSNKVRG